MGFSLGNIGKKLSDYGGDIGNFFGGVGNAVGQGAQAAGNAEANLVNGVGRTVGNFGIGAIKSVVNPAIQGGQALSQIQNNNAGGQPAFQNVNVPQLVSNFGQTVANLGSLVPGAGLAEQGLSTGARVAQGALRGAAINAGYGGVQGGLQAYGQGASPVGIGQSALSGAVQGGALGAVLGGAAPLLTKGATTVVSDARAGFPDTIGNESGKVPLPGGNQKPTVSLKSNVAQSTSPELDQFFADRSGRSAQASTPTIGKGSVIKQGTTGPDQATVNAIDSYKQGNNANIKLPAVPENNPTQAVLNQKAVRSLINDRVQPAIDAANKLSPADHVLLDKTRTTAIGDLAQKADNPTAFTDAANKAKAYNDFTHGLGTSLGQVIPYREKYGAPLLYDLNDPLTAQTLAEQQAKLATTPGYAKERTTNNYAPDLKRLNQNFAQDLATDAQRRGNHISELALAKGLDQAYPGQLKVGELPRGYTQLGVAGGKSLALPDAIAKKLNTRHAAPEVTNPALKAYDALNRGLKYSELGGGTFHALTTTGSAAGQQLTSGNLLAHPIQNLRLIAGTLSKTVHNANMNQLASDGNGGLSTLDKARVAGVTLSPKYILGDANLNVLDQAGSKLNFIKGVHDMVFARQIPEAKLMIFKQATKNLDPNNPTDLGKMRQVASAVNNLGGVNRAIEGLTPTAAQHLSRFALATDFTETKFRKLNDAITKGGPQGTIARQMVIGKVLVMALPGLAVAAAAGKLQSPQDWANEAAKQVFDPQVTTNFKTAAGYGKIAKLPATEVAEVSRILLPIFQNPQDRLSGAKQYVTARSSAGLSTIWSVLTNKDYFGNPVVATDAQGKPDLGKTAENLALSKSFIPIQQGIKVAQGKESLGEAAANTLGARVVTDPNDPAYAQQQAFFKNRDKFVSTLNPNEVALFNAVNPASKDANGNPIADKNSLTTPTDYAILKGHSAFLAKYQAYQQAQPSHDPLWDLNPSQLNSMLSASIISKEDPGGDSKTVSALYKNIPPDFFAERQQYFDNLKNQGVNISSATDSQKPQMSPELSQFADQYQALPYGTGARSAALATPTGQAYISYLDQNQTYNNQQRTDLGLPQLPAQTSSSSSYSSSKSGGSKSAVAKAANPSKYNVSLRVKRGNSNAGGHLAKPKVTAKKPTLKGKVSTRSGGSRVSIKKSLV